MKAYVFAMGVFLSLNSYSQTNFNNELKAADPVKKNDSVPDLGKMAVHQAYLKKALATKNIEQEFYGHLYLWSDNLNKNQYEEATLQLFSADSLARQSGNLSWLAAVHSKRGVLAFELNDAESAFKEYKLALEYCRKTNDTSCLAVNLEELAVTFHRLKKYDSARYYFNLAIPFIRKSDDNQKLYAYYNNYSNLLKDMGDFPGVKVYLDSTIAMAMSNNDLLQQSNAKNNLAAFYIETGEYDKGFEILQELITQNKEYGWADQLSMNYANISEAYTKKNNYRAAFEYLNYYHAINDSLRGTEMQVRMANMKAGYEAQKKELILKQSQLELQLAKEAVQIRTGLIILLLIGVAIKLWLFAAHIKRVKRKKLQSQEDLSELTRILLEKNTALSALEDKVYQLQEDAAIGNSSAPIKETGLASSNDKDDFEKTLYNQRILTDADWTSFKLYFEKAYPGFLLRLRKAHAEITEAEERMFLLIKLNLTNKESAAMLGISTDSIKKTRSRLRKRLNLGEEIDLDTYVKQF